MYIYRRPHSIWSILGTIIHNKSLYWKLAYSVEEYAGGEEDEGEEGLACGWSRVRGGGWRLPALRYSHILLIPSPLQEALGESSRGIRLPHGWAATPPVFRRWFPPSPVADWEGKWLPPQPPPPSSPPLRCLVLPLLLMGSSWTHTHYTTWVSPPFFFSFFPTFSGRVFVRSFVREEVSQFHHVFIDDEWRCMVNYV